MYAITRARVTRVARMSGTPPPPVYVYTYTGGWGYLGQRRE